MTLNSSIASQYLLWFPLAAAIVHIFEEFVFPGGFMAWYRRYRGEATTSITPRFLIIINTVLLLGCWNAATAAHNPKNLWLWLGICAALGSNGVWHLWAAARSRSYSPGMVTGLLLYIPLVIYGYAHFLLLGAVSWSTALLALLIGGSYSFWSAGFHRRSAAG